MTNQNNLENLANVLANLGVQTFNPESGTGVKVNMKSCNTFQLTDQQAKESEQYDTDYRDGIVKSVGDTLQYKTPSGKDVDIESVRTLKNSVGSTKTAVVVGQTVTLAISKHKTDKTKAIYAECIDKRHMLNISDYESLFAEPKAK